MNQQRVLIVAENVSARFGGEAFIPLHYFRILRSRGIEAFVLTHERVREELRELFPDEATRLHFIPDTGLQNSLWQLGQKLPTTIDEISFRAIRGWITQRALRHTARRLVQELKISVVHQPTPVSPRRPSCLYDLGAPVVIGPMNGNMQFPPAFANFRGNVQDKALKLGRGASDLANRLIPGKPRAAYLLVANPRTQQGIPECAAQVPVEELAENGVDLSLFNMSPHAAVNSSVVRFAFVGRLVDWKAVDLLLHAFAGVPETPRVELNIFGDGIERAALEALTKDLGLIERTRFWGFVPQADIASKLNKMHALVLPSLYECGGAVILEAMAKGLPVIATDWGGPSDYLDPTCGILVPPKSRADLILGLREAMTELAKSPQKRLFLGRAGRKKVEREFDWERKVDRALQVYRRAEHQTTEALESDAPPAQTGSRAHVA